MNVINLTYTTPRAMLDKAAKPQMLTYLGKQTDKTADGASKLCCSNKSLRNNIEKLETKLSLIVLCDSCEYPCFDFLGQASKIQCF